MKIALYIEDGLEQIVLSPETPTEKAILGKLHTGTRALRIYHGEFYKCQGGWVRHSANEDSTILVLNETVAGT